MTEPVLTSDNLARIIAATETSEERVLLALTAELALPLREMRDLTVNQLGLSKKPPALLLSRGDIPISIRTSEILRKHVEEMGLAKKDTVFPNQSSQGGFERRLQRMINHCGARASMPTLTLQILRHARLLELAKIMRFEDFAYLTGLSHEASAKWFRDAGAFRPDTKRIAKVIRG